MRILKIIPIPLTDIQEISISAFSAFISTFRYLSNDSNSDSSSDLGDLDLSSYECGEITEEVEDMVQTYSENCNPLEAIYGEPVSEIIKETISTATEETQCVGLKFFSGVTTGEDRNLIVTCTAVCYWCCCETIKKVSPIIAKATVNLLN